MDSSSTLLGIYSYKNREHLGHGKTDPINSNLYTKFQHIAKNEEGNVSENFETSLPNFCGNVKPAAFKVRNVVFPNQALAAVSSQQEIFRHQQMNTRFIEPEQYIVCNTKLLTLRIIFVDMLLVVCNLSSDIIQGMAIIYEHQNFKYGLIACGIMWIPGIPATIHFLSVYRLKMVWYLVIMYAILLLFFYPVVPLLAWIIVLWVKPKDGKITKQFLRAKYGASVAYAIQGCIAASIQLCYQSWLALTGIIPYEWINVKFQYKSWSGNFEDIELPTTALCIFFSILTYVNDTNS